MATKAELEEELNALRAELDAARATTAELKEAAEAAQPEGLGEVLMADAESLLTEFTHEIEEISANKPVLVVLGAFCLGMLLARGR